MSDHPIKSNNGKKKAAINLQLLDQLVDANPDLSEAEILKLYQLQQNAPQVTVALLSGDLNEATKVILASALPEQHDPTNTHSQAQYQIEKKLDSGGQSHVYLAHRNDGTYQKSVVIKVLNQSIEGDTQRQQLMAEMQILADFKHPNIVSILDAVIDDQQRPWMMLELIEGVHIDQFIQQHQLTQKQLVSIFISLAKALKYVHQNHVVHADIKPANVLVETLDGQAHPVIIDFGIASTQGDKHPDSPYVFATPAFASPEQLDTKIGRVDHRSDIYSIGKLMQYLLDIQHQSLPHNRLLNQDLTAIIDYCIATKPEHRYQDTQSLVNDLESFLRDEVVSVSTASSSQLLSRKVKKHKWPLSWALLVTVVTAVLISYSIQQSSQNQALKKGAESSQYYWKSADEISHETRLIYALPVRNIEPDFKALNLKFTQLLDQLSDEPLATQQLAFMSLADASISLGRFTTAQELLLKAFNHTPDNTEVVFKLGKNYLTLYQNEIQSLQNFASPEQRQVQQQRLQQKYFNPALQFLAKAEKLNSKDQLIPSLLSYFRGDYQQALQQLNASNSQMLWPIEHHLLTAQITRDQANQQMMLPSSNNALSLFEHTFNTLNQAKKIARSHPEVYKQLCQTESQILQLKPSTEQNSLKNCDEYLTVLPETADSLLVAADAYAQLALNRLDIGQNPVTLLQKSRHILDHPWHQASTQDMAQAEKIKGHLLSTEGKWQLYSNLGFIESFKQAIKHHQLAVEIQPNNYAYQLDLATAWYNLANNTHFSSETDNYFKLATKILSDLTGHADSTQYLPSFLVRIFTDHAYTRYQNGLSADHQLEQADMLVKQFQLESPSSRYSQLAVATLYWTYADYLVLQNKNPEPFLKQAIEAFDQVINASSPGWTTRYNQVSAMLSGVTYYLEHGAHQTIQLKEIKTKLDSIASLVAEDINLDSHWGYYHNMLAINQLLSNNSPDSSLSQACHFNEACINSPIDGYLCLSQLATSLVTKAKWNLKHPDKRINFHQSHLQRIEQGIKDHPEHHQLLASYGLYLWLDSQANTKSLEIKAEQKIAQLYQAQQYLRRALNGNPLLTHKYSNELTAIESAVQELI